MKITDIAYGKKLYQREVVHGISIGADIKVNITSSIARGGKMNKWGVMTNFKFKPLIINREMFDKGRFEKVELDRIILKNYELTDEESENLQKYHCRIKFTYASNKCDNNAQRKQIANVKSVTKQYKNDIKNLEDTLKKIQYKVIRNQELSKDETSFLKYFTTPDKIEFDKIVKKMKLCNKINRYC